MEDWQYCSVPFRIEEFVRVPAGRERTSFCLAIADDTNCEETRIVKNCAIRVCDHITELTSLMDGARSFGSDVTGYPTGKRELLEELLDTILVLRDVWIKFGVSTFKINVRDNPWSTMSWTSQKDCVQIQLLNQAVAVSVDEV